MVAPYRGRVTVQCPNCAGTSLTPVGNVRADSALSLELLPVARLFIEPVRYAILGKACADCGFVSLWVDPPPDLSQIRQS